MAILWLCLMATSSAQDVETMGLVTIRVLKRDCPVCKAFTPEQILQLATPTYRERKNKEKKVSESPPPPSPPTLVDPSQVSVLGRVDGEKTVKKSETLAGKKKRADESPKPTSKKKSSSKPRSDELRDLDEKWSERFSRLEAMLLSKAFAVPVEPVKKPPSVVTSDQPFFDPGTSNSGFSSGVTVGGTGSSLVQTTGEAAVVSEAASKSATHPVEGPGTGVGRIDEIQQNATQPVEAPGAGTATQPVEAPGVGAEVLLSGTSSAVQSDSEEDLQSEPGSPAGDDFRYGSPDKDVSGDQERSEEASYRETIRGVRSFMGWHKIPEFNSVSSSDDNPFASSRVQPTGKVSVKLPVDVWLCRKMEKLNLIVTEGYPSRNTETAGLLRDQFVKTPRSSGWYDMHADKKDSDAATMCSWSTEPAKPNSAFSRVARLSLPAAPPSRPLSQDILRCWERAAREQTVMGNQAASLSRYLTRVQDAMSTQLKSLHMVKGKGKSSERMQQAVDELEYLVTFNRSVSQAMARTMQDLSEGVFISVATFTLARRDSYLDYLNVGVKQDTLTALRTAPVHLQSLFPGPASH